MTDHRRSRRQFLGSTALAGLGLWGFLRPARAFTTQKMSPALHKAYLSGCQLAPDPYHQQLIADATAKLAPGLTQADITARLAALRCPICGCPVMASLPAIPG